LNNENEPSDEKDKASANVIKDTNSDSKDIDSKDNRMEDNNLNISNSVVYDKDDEMNKSEHKYSKSELNAKVEIIKEERDETINEDEENVEKKIKMVSMTEARRKAVGYERKFCYIIGFPIDLDMEELVTEMINLGCKNPSDIKW